MSGERTDQGGQVPEEDSARAGSPPGVSFEQLRAEVDREVERHIENLKSHGVITSQRATIASILGSVTLVGLIVAVGAGLVSQIAVNAAEDAANTRGSNL